MQRACMSIFVRFPIAVVVVVAVARSAVVGLPIGFLHLQSNIAGLAVGVVA